MQQSQQPSNNSTASDNKKNLLIIGGLAILVIIGGLILAFNYFGGKKADKNANTVENFAEIKEEKSINESTNKESKNNLKSWIQKKVGVKCEINDFGGGKVTIFAKDNKVKIESFGYNTDSQGVNKGNMITDGEWSYTWSGKEGIKINLKDMEKFNQKTDGEKNVSDNLFQNGSWESWVGEIEASGASYNCDVASLSDDDFKVPTDVVFTDWGKQMEQFLNIGENFQQNLPNF